MNNQSFSTQFFHGLDDGRPQCDLCPHECKLKEGQVGLCHARAHQKGQLISLVYGHPIGLAADPIEKKPLFHFLPGTRVLSFGTIGCNLKCQFCQNWHMSTAYVSDATLDFVAPELIAPAALKHQCASVAFTYNEPTIFAEYAIDVAKSCHEQGLKTVAVTNGYINPKARKIFYQHIDAANVDLKAFTETFHQIHTGAHLQPVLDTLIYLKKETTVWLEITTLLIPGKNDNSKEIEALTKWIFKNLGTDVPLHFSAFHPSYKMMDVAPTPLETLEKAREIALNQGLHYVYIGNMMTTEGENTYCPGCKTLLIERRGFQTVQLHLTPENHCPNCHAICAGIFS